MLCQGITKQVDLPHEPGQWIKVRLLGYAALTEAREARSLQAIRKAREMGAELMNSLPDRAPRENAAPPDPLNDYDMPTLLRAGIVEWSYDAKATRENIDSLDEKTARLVALALVPEAESEDDRKNA
jgi:hypothetical protein